MTAKKSRFTLAGRRAAMIAAITLPLAAAPLAYGISTETMKQKLKLLKWQDVMLERVVKDVCLIKSGVEADRNRAEFIDARDRFESAFGDMQAMVAASDQNNPAVKRLTRDLATKRKQWFQLRVMIDRELKAPEPTPTALGQMRLVQTGLSQAVDKAYKVVSRKLMKTGEVTLADVVQDAAEFENAFLAERLVGEACLVKHGAGDANALKTTLVMFGQKLQGELANPAATPEAKALIPAWQAVLPEVMAAADGTPADDLLKRLSALEHEWKNAIGGAAAAG